MIKMILLDGVLEGIAGFLTVTIVLGGIFYGFQWLMAKFAGVRFHGKYQAGQAYRESKMQEDYSRSLAYENPVLFNKAVERCKKKKYALTPFNILTEVYKIEKEEKNASPSFSYTSQVKDKLSKLISTVKTDNSSDTLEKLERLTELYNEGIITKEELTSIKKEIIK